MMYFFMDPHAPQIIVIGRQRPARCPCLPAGWLFTRVNVLDQAALTRLKRDDRAD